MKYIIVLGDGMADYPDSRGLTPLKEAKTPFIDVLAKESEVGLVQTVPKGMSPGSDVANLSVMGYDPTKYYTGRSPLEAVSIGVKLNEGDVAYRLNFVTLSNEESYEKKTMLDYSAGEIETNDAAKLIEILKPFVPKGCELFSGVSYRHCLVWRGAGLEKAKEKFTPPHDITDKVVGDFLPPQPLLDFMKKSHEVLSSHPNNHTKANSAWIWGAGTKPSLPDFNKEFGVLGAVISPVDLIKGIAICANMKSIDVEGSTATLTSDFDAEARAAIDALNTHDFMFLHIEAPDECGHQGDRKGKIKSIEILDNKILQPIVEELKKRGDFRLLFLPDHATPLALKTHTSDHVPYLLYDSKVKKGNGAKRYTEDEAAKTGKMVDKGYDMIKKLLKR